ncbi:hypothetical protein GWK16_10735 [Roseomonas sp. JC162]|uniref:Tetratricopeptide repeat protein n=1 Tax=Neoroseomonas marina TaxID=1232220 RepID=A0A848EDW4_9PROT|nr:hypothetical protein [Neoroseomonas marina]NMJ41719.1 hypothetical protein [Neoroseomonas marina]
MRGAAAGMALLLVLAAPAGAQEAPRVPLRVGTHADHGRLVFDWPRRVGYSVAEEPDGLRLRFEAPGEIDLGAARRPTRNLVAVAEENGAILIRAAPGARIRHFRLGNRVVVDLMDAAPATPPAPPRPPPEPLAPPRPRSATAEVPPPPEPARPAPPAAEARAEPRPAPVAAAVPGPLSIRPARDRAAIVVPAGEGSGLALLRRGDSLIAILDRALDFDLGMLRGHPVFAGMEMTVTPDATILRLPAPAPARLQARREGTAWTIEATRDTPAEAPTLRAVPDPGPPPRLALQGAADPGGIVAVADAETGETIIVATLRAPGPGMASGRRLPEIDLLPTMMGAAVLARSDRVSLRALPDRIVVEAAGGALAFGPAAGREPPPRSAALTRLLDLPVAPVPTLLERLRVQLLAVNEAPPLSRGALRRDAAETLLALGMPQEAQAMAGLALREDPRARDDARLILAQGAAALLAGRPAEARGIADPRLPPGDEVDLWRALLSVAQGEPAFAALVAGAPLLLAYPEALRDRLLPVALEAMATGGEAARAARLVTEAADVPGLDLARALVAEAEGRDAEALAAFDAIGRGADRRQRGIALRRAAERRLARGDIDAAGAARALEQSLFAWRGGAQEVALRRRIAALRIAAGEGPAAFAMVEEAARYFPEDADALRPDLRAAFAAALQTAPPAAATMMFDAHPDLLPEGAAGEAAVLLLADRLAALDLSGRAAALLDQAAARATPEARAAIGARLASLRLRDGEPGAAIAALDRSAAAGLPEPLARQRMLLRARAMARRGERIAADQMLADLGPAGAEPRAELRAEAQDWAGAAAAQMEHLAAAIPPPPVPLGQTERVAVVRAAAYAALAGDEALLAGLRESHGMRMDGGPLAEAFALMTSDPLRGIADLPRLQREIGMLRVLPARLEALRGGVQVAR